jgi:hypothetical protein
MTNFSAPPQPPAYNNSNTTQFNSYPLTLEQKYQNIVRKYEISTLFAQKLQILQSYKIVFVFDDSGSMNTTLQDSPLNNNNSLFKATRWDELQYFANISIEIASIFNPNGCDIYFLNRFPSPLKNITDPAQLVNYFHEKPQGFTPLTRTLNLVLNDNPPHILGERKLLIVLATDGEPTDTNGKVNIPEFKNVLMFRPSIVYTSIVACTDDDGSISYLNRWDRDIPRLGFFILLFLILYIFDLAFERCC